MNETFCIPCLHTLIFYCHSLYVLDGLNCSIHQNDSPNKGVQFFSGFRLGSSSSGHSCNEYQPPLVGAEIFLITVKQTIKTTTDLKKINFIYFTQHFWNIINRGWYHLEHFTTPNDLLVLIATVLVYSITYLFIYYCDLCCYFFSFFFTYLYFLLLYLLLSLFT